MSGGPKHNTSVIAIGRWAAPSTSRITPPTPVLAPPNGSTADGWLWVSALSAIVVPGRYETMPALPTNADRTNGAAMASVHRRSTVSSGGRSSPVSVTSVALNVLWEQCSLHVWAMVSSSTSVGSRPSATKCCWTASSSSGSRASARSTPTCSSAARESSRTGTTAAVPSERPPDVRSGSIGPNAQRSMIGLATTRRTMSSAVAGSMAGRTRPGDRSRPPSRAPRAGRRRASRRPPPRR